MPGVTAPYAGTSLSVVVPCFNEQDVLAEFFEHLRDAVDPLVDQWEVVLVDDGSRDRTLDVIRALAEQNPHVRYISLSRNFGKEAAMLAGLTYATGDAVVLMDADLQHPPRLISQMLERFREGYDQVVAKRTREGDRVGRTFASRTYYWLVNRLVDVTLVDGVGDFRLLSRRAVDALLAMREYNRFSKGMFSWIGFSQVAIEYDNESRAAGETKWSFGRLLNYGVDGVLSFNNKPLRMSIYLGLAVTLLSLAYVAWEIVAVTVRGVDVPGYVTLLSAVVFLGGVQLIFLGVIGEYVGRIYYETKRRPHYVVQTGNITPP